MTERSVFRIACCILACLALTTAAAQAQLDEGMMAFEIYGGNYAPGPGDFDDESSFGVRFGGMATERVVLIGSLGQVEFDGTATDGMVSTVWDSETTMVDFTIGYVFRAGNKFSIAVGGGIGGAFTDFNGQLQTPTLIARFDSLSSDSFTLNAVVGPIIHLGSRVYLKPLVRARWFEARDDDEVDIESTLAFGFKW